MQDAAAPGATPDHDPDAPGVSEGPDGGVFGLPHPRASAGIVLLPVPSEMTCSYRTGTAAGPRAIRQASPQLDLEDRRFGPIWRAGVHMEPQPAHLAELAWGGRKAYEQGDTDLATRAGERVLAHAKAETASVLAEGKIPGLVGGEHAVSLGAILACCEAAPDDIGVLQIDAHMDLRDAYEGCRFSHASVMRNALETTDARAEEHGARRIAKLVQVGVRDVSKGELDFAAADGRVKPAFAEDLHAAVLSGKTWHAVLQEAIAELPELVYLSFDTDALEPHLCPNTGTPVPGGLTWPQACLLLAIVAESGRRVVGFDLVEVSPGPAWTDGDPDTLDAIVGARMLYRLCGLAAATNGLTGARISPGDPAA